MAPRPCQSYRYHIPSPSCVPACLCGLYTTLLPHPHPQQMVHPMGPGYSKYAAISGPLCYIIRNYIWYIRRNTQDFPCRIDINELELLICTYECKYVIISCKYEPMYVCDLIMYWDCDSWISSCCPCSFWVRFQQNSGKRINKWFKYIMYARTYV